jgi:hypothetical protein
VLWRRRRQKEGFQAPPDSTKPYWLDDDLWSPLSRTMFAFKYWYWYPKEVYIYDKDLAQIALEMNGNDPVAARAALDKYFMFYVRESIRRGTAPVETTPDLSQTQAQNDLINDIGSANITPINRTQCGIKKDATTNKYKYDCFVYPFGDVQDIMTNTNQWIRRILGGGTMRSVPASIAQRALDNYGDPVTARQKLVAGTAFQEELQAKISDATKYGILTEKPAIGISDYEWNPVNRVMYQVLTYGDKSYFDMYNNTTRFERDVAEFALSQFNNDPVAARIALLTDGDFYKSWVANTRRKAAAFDVTTINQATLKADSCKQLDTIKATLTAQIAAIRPGIQDLSGSAITMGDMKAENLNYQKQITALCRENINLPGCRELATRDENLFPLFAEYEQMNTELFTYEVDLKEAVKIVNQTYDLLKCPLPAGGKLRYEVEKDVGYIDTETLRMRVSELSPYYISPVIIGYLTQLLTNDGQISQPALEAKEKIGVVAERVKDIKGMISSYAK